MSKSKSAVLFDPDTRVPARAPMGQWLPGHSGNPRGAQRHAYREVTQLARDHSMEAMRKLIDLTKDPDSRVAYMAVTHLLERAHGKPREYDPKEDAPPTLDLLKLSAEERDYLRQLITKAQDDRLLTTDVQSVAQIDISVDKQRLGQSDGS